MTPIAEATWPTILAQTRADLAPFPGRFALAWRVALLCAIVTAAAMLYEIPEAAISCYLVIYLMRADASESIGQAVGVIGLATGVVAMMIPLIDMTIDAPFLRLLVMAGVSFVMLYLSSATPLGENAAIIALVITFIMTLVGNIPAGIVATMGLKYAWEMAVMPMALMAAFCLALGRGPQGIVADRIAARLRAAATVLETPHEDEALLDLLGEGNADTLKRALIAKLLHLVPTARSTWLAGAAETSYRVMVAAAALTEQPREETAAARARLAAACRAAAAAIAGGAVPTAPERAQSPGSPAELFAWRALEGLAAQDGGARPKPALPPLLAADAFTSPIHSRYALKTTAAAIVCYLIYTGIGWSGIHTAIVTCYVAALGTTGETVHKLALRIAGCLVGAAMGVFSIAFVIPHLGSIGGLMVLVFVGVLIAAWVSSGPERISYGGVQVGLAFLLTILVGFGPSTDMSNASDRIVGILLGNFIIFLIFTNIWPRGVADSVRDRLGAALGAMARVAATAPDARAAATKDVAEAAAALGEARAALFLLPFEPARQQPAPAEVERLIGLTNAAGALLPAIAVSREGLDDLAVRLAAMVPVAERAEGTAPAGLPQVALAGPAGRLEQLARGA